MQTENNAERVRGREGNAQRVRERREREENVYIYRERVKYGEREREREREREIERERERERGKGLCNFWAIRLWKVRYCTSPAKLFNRLQSKGDLLHFFSLLPFRSSSYPIE